MASYVPEMKSLTFAAVRRHYSINSKQPFVKACGVLWLDYIPARQHLDIFFHASSKLRNSSEHNVLANWPLC
jgi:hypothetical protein